MAFYYLLLGHLIGDFVLQTDRIAENKSKRWNWNLLHVLVVSFCILSFTYNFGDTLIYLVFLNGVIHFTLDYYKKEIARFLNISELAGFILDQLLHLLFLFLISKTANYGSGQLLDFNTVRILIALALVTSFSAVFNQFILTTIFPRADGSFFKDGEKRIGIVTRLYVTFIIYLSMIFSPYYLVMLIVAALILILQFKMKWNKWMSHMHLFAKLLLDTVLSVACISLIIL